MASIGFGNITETTIAVYLKDMDTTYEASDRICYWYIGNTQYGSRSLSAKASTGGYYTFSGLSAGTTYNIKAIVTNGVWTATFGPTPETTKEQQHYSPSINSFSVSQTYAGSNYARCSCSVSSLESGATYKIEAQSSAGTWVEKASGTASSSFSVTIELDEYRTYNILLTVTNYTGYYDPYTTTVKMKPPNFSWTYAKTSGGNFNLTADEWNGLWDAIALRKGYTPSHTVAYPGNTFTAAMYKQAVDAIGKGTPVSGGDPITAALMDELVTNVNSMS